MSGSSSTTRTDFGAPGDGAGARLLAALVALAEPDSRGVPSASNRRRDSSTEYVEPASMKPVEPRVLLHADLIEQGTADSRERKRAARP
jgi:hypothetical protein